MSEQDLSFLPEPIYPLFQHSNIPFRGGSYAGRTRKYPSEAGLCGTLH